MKRLAIYAHFDRRDEVKRYVTHFLARLREACDRVIFVTNSALTDHELDKVRPYCEGVIQRNNVGFDFAMWAEALRGVDLGDYDELVLANSSVFGPVGPLDSIFRAMSASSCDFWGATESDEISPHLQSYFLVFRSRVLRSSAFDAFFRSVLPYRDKWQVTLSYELGLSRFLVGEGFRYEALFSVDRLRALDRPWHKKSTNPTLRFAAQLIEQGLPFVKLELFRKNPLNAPLEPLYRALEAAGYDRALVEVDA